MGWTFFWKNFWPPKNSLWRHNRGPKIPKISFLDLIRSFFNQSRWNLAKVLRLIKHKFLCILTPIDPLYDVIIGGQNVRKSFFLPKSIIFQPISMKLGKNVENGKTQILEYFGRNWPPLWRHQGVKKPKNEFFGPNSAIFQPISMKLGKPINNDKTQILVYFGQIWTPLWRHNRGLKCPKITFFDQNRSFFI